MHKLTHPRSRGLRGPAPRVDGRPLAPRDVWGHDVLWWLDRMVRSEAPLVERMTLVWHDWFATSRAAVDTRWMLDQNELLRRHALGELPRARARRSPATRRCSMLAQRDRRTTKAEPNENYARELQELFTLGAGRGYSERDVREMARALTGWRADWRNGVGMTNFRFDRESHDGGRKRVYGRRGRFDWRDAADLAVGHRLHPSFFVTKLWSYFIPTPPPDGTRRALAAALHALRPRRPPGRRRDPPPSRRSTRGRGWSSRRPSTSPACCARCTAGSTPTRGRGSMDMSGQTLFAPPNVAGWDDTRWIDTATWRGRWMAANWALEGHTLDPDPEKTRYPSLKQQGPARGRRRRAALLGRPRA